MPRPVYLCCFYINFRRKVCDSTLNVASTSYPFMVASTSRRYSTGETAQFYMREKTFEMSIW
ncbi:hypothetical protein K449DRAFT_381914 [Hypoxylon sp. EC38]|nr:hypothetical protein K449DRAFT_381914 [Hypoxylon sp. EC38]